MTDSQLIREIKDGNVHLYRHLVLRYERKIVTFIQHMLKFVHREHWAEDLSQETFYKAYKSLDTFREGEASFATWLYTIARNTALSELRKRHTQDVYWEEETHIPVASQEMLPEHQLLYNEKTTLVRTAIGNLPEKQRTALILREYEQLDYVEIAHILRTTVSSVKSLLFRARAGIREQMETYVRGTTHAQEGAK